MSRSRLVLPALIGLVIASSGIARAAQETPPGAEAAQSEGQTPARDLWVMAGARALVLGGEEAAVRAQLEIGENGELVAASADGSLVAVGSLGPTTGGEPGKDDPLLPKPGGSSSVTLIRRPGHDTIARVPIAFRPGFVGFSPDGATLIVVSRGQVHKDPKKHVPAGVSLVDAATGAKRAELPLSSEPADVWYATSTNRLILPLRGLPPGAAAELVVVDVTAGTSVKIPLPSAPVELHDSGAEGVRYLEMKAGVAVVTADGALRGESIKAGEKPIFKRAPSGDRYLLAGQVGKKGQLKVIEGGEVAKTLDVPKTEAIVFDSKGTKAIVCSSKEGMVLDTAELTEKGRFKVPGPFTDIQIDPSGGKLYTQMTQGVGAVGVVDLKQGKKVAVIRSGRFGKMFGKMLARALPAAMASALLIPAIPIGSAGGYTLMYQPIIMPGAPRAVSSFAFSPDGQRAFIFNDFTKDVTVVDTASSKSLRKVATGAVPKGVPFLWLVGNDRNYVSCGLRKLLVFDTGTGALKVEKEFPETASLRCEPAAGVAFATSASGTEAYRIDPFEKIKDLGRLTGVAYEPSTKRFVIATAKGTDLYDAQLNTIRSLENVGRVDALHLVPEHASAVPPSPPTP